MKRIPKAQLETIEMLTVDIKTAEADLTDEILTYNQRVVELQGPVKEALRKYNDKLDDLRGVYEELADKAREYYDERSDTWQESASGQAYGDWLIEMENVDLEDIDLDLPTELNEPDYPDVEDIVPIEPGL